MSVNGQGPRDVARRVSQAEYARKHEAIRWPDRCDHTWETDVDDMCLLDIRRCLSCRAIQKRTTTSLTRRSVFGDGGWIDA